MDISGAHSGHPLPQWPCPYRTKAELSFDVVLVSSRLWRSWLFTLNSRATTAGGRAWRMQLVWSGFQLQIAWQPVSPVSSQLARILHCLFSSPWIYFTSVPSRIYILGSRLLGLKKKSFVVLSIAQLIFLHITMAGTRTNHQVNVNWDYMWQVHDPTYTWKRVAMYKDFTAAAQMSTNSINTFMVDLHWPTYLIILTVHVRLAPPPPCIPPSL